MNSLIIPFLVYYLVIFAVNYIVVEYGQYFLYDEATPAKGLKVALGSLILASFLTWTHSSFATMFTDDIGKTVLQAILWFGVFVLIYRFHPWHGGGIALATMLIFAGMATLVVDSLTQPKTTARIDTQAPPSKPPRRSFYNNATPAKTDAPPAPAPTTKAAAKK
jgi:hypothetical protein